MLETRLTRRALIHRLAAGGLAAGGALLAACGGSASAPAPSGGASSTAPAPAPASSAPAPAPSPAAGAAAPAAVSSPAVGSATGSAYNWKRFAGTRLRFMNNTHDWSTDVIPKALPEFEALTGMKVSWEVLPENQFRQKLTLELRSNPESVDGYMSLTSWDGLAFLESGWYEPIEPYIKSSDLTAPDFNVADFFPNTLKIATVKDTLIGVPLYPEVQLLYYNKEKLDAKGVKVPETIEELVAAAEKLHDPGANFAGYVSRGDGIQAVYTLAPFIFALGGRWLDENGRPELTSDAFVKALDTYATLLRKYGPPGVAGMQWAQAIVVFHQGNAAMLTDSSNFVSTFEDPTKSAIVGKVGYAPLPAGPAGIRSTLISWSLSICAKSKNKEATWQFIQWLSSQDMVARQAKAKIPVARQSVWNSPEYQSLMPKGWLDSFNKELPTAAVNQANPNVIPVPEVRDVLGKAIVGAIQGGDARELAAKAQQEMLQVLKLS